LDNLPFVIREIEKKWSIKVENHYPNLSYNYVAPGRFSDGGEVVIKIGMPEKNSELFDEARVLRGFDGKGMIKILDFDKTLEVFLLEKVSPGKSLKEVFEMDKDKAAEVAINILKNFLRKPKENETFPKIKTWFDDFERDRKNNNLAEFAKASKKLKELNSETEKHFILHADFHHDNILSSERDGFLAIDPNGMIGHIGYDIAVFLNNQAIWIYGEEDFEKSLTKIIKQFSESFDVSPKNLIDWAYSQQVLSAFWEFEDNMKTWKHSLEFAEIWKQVKF
jgi:streptomycin 6-kinase